MSGAGNSAARALADTRDNLGKDLPLNWIQFINTHSAFNNNADGYPDPNQWYSLSDQLTLGARWLDLDAHPINGHLKLCHADNNGDGCRLTDRLFSSGVKEIAAWLRPSSWRCKPGHCCRRRSPRIAQVSSRKP